MRCKEYGKDGIVRRIYHRVLALSASPAASWWLVAVAFAEASVFPIPPDVLLVPMILERPRRAGWFALICTLGSVTGGALGYLIGALLFDQLARPILEAYGYAARYAQFQHAFAQYGLRLILVKGLTPIPYKIITIAAGAARFNFGTFMVASVITRGLRFGLVALLLRLFGEPIRHFIERWLTLVTTVMVLCIIAGFVALRFF